MSRFLDAANLLLGCFQTALQAPHIAPIAPEHVMLRAGAEVTPLLGTNDDECCRGMAWVRIASITGVRQINSTAAGDSLCFRGERTLLLEMGAVRCAPTSPKESVPTEDQWNQAATLADADQSAMEQAICCAFNDLDGPDTWWISDVAVQEYQPTGVDGNCIGGTMTIELTFNRCC